MSLKSKDKQRFRKEKDNIGRLEPLEDREYKTTKKVYQYDLKGNFIREWKSATEASDKLGDVSRTSINNNCMSISKKRRKYKFSFKKII